MILYPRIKIGFVVGRYNAEEDLPKTGPRQRSGAIIMFIGILVGLIGGLAVAVGGGQELFNFAQAGEGVSIVLIAGLGVLATFVGSLMQ